MNPKARLMAALKQQPVDRMPVMTYNFHPFDDRWHLNPDGRYTGPPGYQSMMDAVWRTGQDGKPCPHHGQWGATGALALCGAAMRARAKPGKGEG